MSYATAVKNTESLREFEDPARAFHEELNGIFSDSKNTVWGDCSKTNASRPEIYKIINELHGDRIYSIAVHASGLVIIKFQTMEDMKIALKTIIPIKGTTVRLQP